MTALADCLARTAHKRAAAPHRVAYLDAVTSALSPGVSLERALALLAEAAEPQAMDCLAEPTILAGYRDLLRQRETERRIEREMRLGRRLVELAGACPAAATVGEVLAFHGTTLPALCAELARGGD